jgi:hypothetical protein
VDTNEEDLAETPCRLDIQTKRDEYTSMKNQVHIEIQNLMKDSFIHQPRDSFLEAKDFVINDEYRNSIGRNDLIDKYQTAAESRTNEGLRCLSPSSSNNYFKNNSRSAMGFAASKAVKKKR